jgi:hypothetical protein
MRRESCVCSNCGFGADASEQRHQTNRTYQAPEGEPCGAPFLELATTSANPIDIANARWLRPDLAYIGVGELRGTTFTLLTPANKLI